MKNNLVTPFNFTAIIEKIETLEKEIQKEKDLYKQRELLKQERAILQSTIDRYLYLNAN